MWKIQYKGVDYDWTESDQNFETFFDAWGVLNLLQSAPPARFFQYRISKTFN